MRNWNFIVVATLFLIQCGRAQETNDSKMVLNPEFDKTIVSYLDFSVPVISCETLRKDLDQFNILDVREFEEFQVSHLKGAFNIGFDNFTIENLPAFDKTKPIVVYCSIGYRSEKIGEKLKKQGFTRVYNLYGSIFEWINQGYPVYDNEGHQVSKVHTYNKKWSKWVENTHVEKIW